jgi:hypothetical protein
MACIGPQHQKKKLQPRALSWHWIERGCRVLNKHCLRSSLDKHIDTNNHIYLLNISSQLRHFILFDIWTKHCFQQ